MSKRIKGFDGLRAIAFLLVFVSHKWVVPVTDRLGSVAVWLFFVLSGFLITRILADQKTRIEAGQAKGQDSLIGFYRSRALRIFPAYYTLLAVLALFAASGHYNLESAGRQWANWLFYSNIYIEAHGWKGDLGHLWSLAVEQQYYLLFAPLVFFVVPRSRLPALCVALLGVSIVAHIFFLIHGAPLVTFDVNSFINIGLFGMGGLAGLYAARPLPRWMLNDVAIVAVLVLFLSIASLPVPYFSEYGRVAGVLAACLLVQITQRQESAVVAALDVAPVRWLGVISYAAYLFHPVIHSDSILAFFGVATPAHRWTIVMDFAITVVLATASWILLEAPLMRLGRRRRTKAPQNNAQALQKG